MIQLVGRACIKFTWSLVITVKLARLIKMYLMKPIAGRQTFV